MTQCAICQWILMHGARKGKGKCWKDADGTGKPLDVLEVRKCKLFQLAPMIQVKGRGVVFGTDGKAKLKEGR